MTKIRLFTSIWHRELCHLRELPNQTYKLVDYRAICINDISFLFYFFYFPLWGKPSLYNAFYFISLPLLIPYIYSFKNLTHENFGIQIKNNFYTIASRIHIISWDAKLLLNNKQVPFIPLAYWKWSPKKIRKYLIKTRELVGNFTSDYETSAQNVFQLLLHCCAVVYL